MRVLALSLDAARLGQLALRDPAAAGGAAPAAPATPAPGDRPETRRPSAP